MKILDKLFNYWVSFMSQFWYCRFPTLNGHLIPQFNHFASNRKNLISRTRFFFHHGFIKLTPVQKFQIREILRGYSFFAFNLDSTVLQAIKTTKQLLDLVSKWQIKVSIYESVNNVIQQESSLQENQYIESYGALWEIKLGWVLTWNNHQHQSREVRQNVETNDGREHHGKVVLDLFASYLFLSVHRRISFYSLYRLVCTRSGISTWYGVLLWMTNCWNISWKCWVFNRAVIDLRDLKVSRWNIALNGCHFMGIVG